MKPITIVALALSVVFVGACKPKDPPLPANFFVRWSMPSPEQSQFTPQGTGWTPSGTLTIMLMFEPIRPAEDSDRPWTTRARHIGNATADTIGSFGLDASPAVTYTVNRMCGGPSLDAVQPAFVAHDLASGQKRTWTATSADWYTHTPC